MKGKKKKIVFLISTYTKNMGYIYVCLPEAMSRLENVEVHVVTSQAQMYFDSPYYKETYEKFHGKAILPVGTEKLQQDLYLHRCRYKTFKTELYIDDLFKTLKKIKPDIVHTFDCNSINSFKLALFKPLLRYKFFPGNSIVLSVFPLDKQWGKLPWWKKMDWNIKHVLPGKFISLMATRIFPSTIDAAYIAKEYFGANSKKIKVSPLGVDTVTFSPIKSFDEKNKLKIVHDFNIDDFICIYTGRMTFEKNPLLLAQAIEWINETKGFSIKGLFLGEGIQSEDISAIKNMVVLGFKNYKELPTYYHLSDIGVWPTQESTSMIDAAACGLPIIVSDRLKAVERVEGNGLQYKENDFKDLAKKILELYNNKGLYSELSLEGSKKMEKEYSWNKIAKEKLIDYEK